MGKAAAATAISDPQRWLEEKRLGIGRFDSPVMLGISPFKSPLSTWHEKRGNGNAEEPPIPPMQRNDYLKILIAQIYS